MSMPLWPIGNPLKAILKFLPVAIVDPATGDAIGGASNPSSVSGFSSVAGVTFTRPGDTTPYTSGDLVANNTVAASVTPLMIAASRKTDTNGRILRARLSKTGTSTTNASFRIHLFKNNPAVTVGDNGAFAGGVAGIAAIHLGYIDVTMDQAFSDGAKGIAAPAVGPFITFDPSTGTANIFALIEARAAYTPVSGEVFTLALEVDRD